MAASTVVLAILRGPRYARAPQDDDVPLRGVRNDDGEGMPLNNDREYYFSPINRLSSSRNAGAMSGRASA